MCIQAQAHPDRPWHHQEQLAEAVGVQCETIGSIERSEYSPNLDLGLRIARLVDLRVEALFSLDAYAPLDGRALTGE